MEMRDCQLSKDRNLEQRLLTYKDLAERWQRKESGLRNARPEDLPPRFKAPNSRLVRFRLVDVLDFEERHSR